MSQDNYIPRQASKFPTMAARQRTSNINTDNAELEFQKTALSFCRSTISQQETEIKKLKETLDIRNRRITQLESMLGHAADNIANRDFGSSVSNSESLVAKFGDLCKKLESSNTSNNIIVNSCKHNAHSSKQSSYTQTEVDLICPAETGDVVHNEENDNL